MIVFIGSVFSPWYRLARRHGGGNPENHCAVNVALYGAGGKRWTMTERGTDSLHRNDEFVQVGRSSFRWESHALVAEIDETTAPMPSRVAGTITIHPAAIATHEVALDGLGRHRWSPIAPSARVEVALSHPSLRWAGTGYVDTNSGDAPLEEGFTNWHWCRAPLEQGTAVLYHGQRVGGEAFCEALRYAPDGSVERFTPPPPAALPSSLWRLPRSTRADPGKVPRIVQSLEDAPFYARSVIETRLLGREVTAVHESLSLTRFVAPVVQMMLPFKAPTERMFFFEKKNQKTFAHR